MLLERSGQLDALRAALTMVRKRAQGHIVLLAGEAGAGKTALLREFRAGPGGPGRSDRVFWAACDPLFTPRPLGALIDLADAMDGELQIPIGPEVKPYDLAAGLMNVLKQGEPAVVVLEDLHWADEATLDVVRLLARRIDQLPALLVLSYRDDEVGRSHPLRVVLGDLPKGGLVTRVAVGGLSPEAVARLAAPTGFDAGKLHDQTAGNPFFVTEVLASGKRMLCWPGRRAYPRGRSNCLTRSRLCPVERKAGWSASWSQPMRTAWTSARPRGC
jgi:predicted ATPase